MKATREQNGSVMLPHFHHRAITACACVLALAARAQAQPALAAPFTQITTGPIVTESSMWTTPAWGDYDNDGWLDLFVGTFDGNSRNALFHNNRDGTFAKVTTGPLVTELSPMVFGAAWADYDNDGWLDMVISSNARGTQAPRLYRNAGGGSFVRMTATDVGSLATEAAHSFGASWADYDGDGHLDLYIANGSTDLPLQDFLYHNERNGRFERVVNSVGMSWLATAYGSWADFDNDGDSDLLVNQIDTRNELYRNDGLGQFTEVTDGSGISGTGSVSYSSAWGDYDNDGDLDLLIINMGWGGPPVRNWFYRNKGDGTFAPITAGPIAEDQDHFAVGSWVDYDNDGWLDLFVTILGPTTTVPGVFNRLYRNQGDGTFARVTAGSLVTLGGRPGSGAAWADFDNDGFLDVCVTYGALFNAQRNALFRNNGNTNNWIKIRCIGTDSNRSAIGAKVRVKARIGGADRWQLRSIGCDLGNSFDAVIGLGDATVIDTLRVEWPSGRVQEFHNVSAKQTLTIVERTQMLIASESLGECLVTVRGPRQQSYQIEASTNLTAWSWVGSVTITNVDGTASYQHAAADKENQMFFRATPQSNGVPEPAIP
jgi:hypothetical protein